MKLYKLTILVLAAVLLSSSLTYFAYSMTHIVHSEKIHFDFEIYDKVGFNLDDDMMHFGSFPAGTSSGMRRINVTNTYDYPLRVYMEPDGIRQDWISFNQNNFILEPSRSKEVQIRIRAPAGTPYGNFSGDIGIRFKRI